MYDVKGRFVLRSVLDKEKYKLIVVKSKCIGTNKVPYITTNDGRTIRYPHPAINIHDTLK